jgi:DNA-binding transcriptional regulator YiaG
MIDANNAASIIETFGTRLQAIRGFLRLPRETFAQRHGIPAVTLKAWELSKSTISNTHMSKLLNALEKEGIHCSTEWLLEGKGASPFLAREGQSNGTLSGIYAEQDCFLKNNPQSLIQTVPDMAMSPYFEKGDYVGGVKADLNDKIEKKDAFIVYVADQPEPLIRFIHQDKSKNFILVHANLNEWGYDFRVHPEIREAYKIIWHRRKT